jgi:hypothetical protein|tara:strand:+ start:119 stop:436 length:318 start_codon:yes stop_codon:yes gene_type:complete
MRLEIIYQLEMQDRLQQIITFYCGGNHAEFARRLGIAKSTLKSRMDQPERASFKFIVDILKLFPEISAEWLLRGEGSMTNRIIMRHSLNLAELANDLKFIKKKLS